MLKAISQNEVRNPWSKNYLFLFPGQNKVGNIFTTWILVGHDKEAFLVVLAVASNGFAGAVAVAALREEDVRVAHHRSPSVSPLQRSRFSHVQVRILYRTHFRFQHWNMLFEWDIVEMNYRILCDAFFKIHNATAASFLFSYWKFGLLLLIWKNKSLNCKGYIE